MDGNSDRAELPCYSRPLHRQVCPPAAGVWHDNQTQAPPLTRFATLTLAREAGRRDAARPARSPAAPSPVLFSELLLADSGSGDDGARAVGATDDDASPVRRELRGQLRHDPIATARSPRVMSPDQAVSNITWTPPLASAAVRRPRARERVDVVLFSVFLFSVSRAVVWVRHDVRQLCGATHSRMVWPHEMFTRARMRRGANSVTSAVPIGSTPPMPMPADPK
jgi:hypothetical protein